MRRRLLNLLTLLSMMLCVAACVLWVRSYRGGESLERVDPARRIVFTSYRGALSACRSDGTFAAGVPFPAGTGVPPADAWQRWAYWGGFGSRRRADADGFAYCPLLGGQSWWSELGFGAGDRECKPTRNAISLHDWLSPTWGGRQRWLTLPYWSLAAALLVAPLVRTAGFLRRRRHHLVRGRCTRCGYDLRATPGRCPECGAVPSTPAPPAG